RRLTGKELGWVADLKEEVDRMSVFTRELLDLAQLELHVEPVVLGPTRVADAVAQATRGIENTEVQVDVPDTLVVHAHPEYLARAVANVARVAARQPGPIEITARATAGTAIITVTDSGPSVPEEALSRLFEPFCRVDSARDVGS